MTRKPRVQSGRFGSRSDVAGTFFNLFDSNPDAIKTLPEQLAERLVELIINGTFQPGERLHEVMLSERFEVSRGPVREALRLLEREGLVTMASRRGASVTKLTEKHLKDIFPVRAALMSVCAEELALRHSDAVQELLDEATEKLFEASRNGDISEYIVLVYQASMYIAEASGNEIARRILFSLGRQTLSITRMVFEDAGHRKDWSNNWCGIVDGIRANDPAAARIAVFQLIGDIKAAALDALRRRDEAAHQPAKSAAAPGQDGAGTEEKPRSRRARVRPGAPSTGP
ncbi:GntR family transcriptional regulator [Xanthobacter pseudotagetidis]|uniref:GntR family transcriptional regulator n=1 Tax=Xanthobacter pseudotagetidis TaxID=3119911 RepID=UPI003728509D